MNYLVLKFFYLPLTRTFKGGYLDFSHLTEVEKKYIYGIPLKGYVVS